MKNEDALTKSLTDWTRVDAMRDEEIDFSDGSEVTAKMFAKAVVRRGLKPVPSRAKITLQDTRTALNLSPLQWQQYNPYRETDEAQELERWQQAWLVARQAGQLLRYKFGATRVVVFGSLAHRGWFTAWSDIDLAVWGVPDTQFYRAVAAVMNLNPNFKVDVVDPADCYSSVRESIEQEGIEL